MKPSETNTTAAEILAQLEARDDCYIQDSHTGIEKSEWPTLKIELILDTDE